MSSRIFTKSRTGCTLYSVQRAEEAGNEQDSPDKERMRLDSGQ